MDFRRALNDNVSYNDNGELCMDTISLAKVAEEHSTPLYVYSLERVRQRYHTIVDAYRALLPSVSVHYSMKANANFAILKALIALGCGIDCVSGGEVFKALKAGCAPENIVFAGVGKTYKEIDFAVSKGVCWFDVENEHELDHLEAATKKNGRVGAVNVALRVNPDVQADTHPRIATGHGSAKFGLPLATVARIFTNCERDYPDLRFKGLHLHIGSQLGSTESTVKALQQTIDGVGSENLKKITHVNIGGGLPANYGSEKTLPTSHVMLEPGRSIVGEAGVLLTEVLYRKEQDGQKMLIVDASMTDLMRPALYSAPHPTGPVSIDSGNTPPPSPTLRNTYQVVGPVCESTDVLHNTVILPDKGAEPGSLLAILTSGAYGASMASNYNARGMAAEIAIDNGNAFVARHRQTYEDLVRDEVFAK